MIIIYDSRNPFHIIEKDVVDEKSELKSVLKASIQKGNYGTQRSENRLRTLYAG